MVAHQAPEASRDPHPDTPQLYCMLSPCRSEVCCTGGGRCHPGQAHALGPTPNTSPTSQERQTWLKYPSSSKSSSGSTPPASLPVTETLGSQSDLTHPPLGCWSVCLGGLGIWLSPPGDPPWARPTCLCSAAYSACVSLLGSGNGLS